MSKGTSNLSFKYNDSGIRTEKTVNGVSTKYYLTGDKVTLEDKGTDKIYYSYDGAGNLVSMNLNGAEYYYIRDAQGDIIGLFNSAGTQVVSYTYDSWGKLISTTGSSASTVGVKNPYLYRGYRFDSETGLYYLQSRYYSPEWGRFINADGNLGSRGDLLSHNLFAYCKNNPVNYSDPNGEWLLDALFLAMDIAAFSSNPSLGSAAWILLDIVCFADPTGIGSTSAHLAKTAHVLEETAHAADIISHTGKIAKGMGEAAEDGIVYLRTDLKTGNQYVGQAKSEARFEARQAEHARANKDAEYIFEEIGRANPGKNFDILEQKMINKFGGLKKNGGLLDNKRNQIRQSFWGTYGIE